MDSDDFEEAAKRWAARDWRLFGPPEKEDFTPSLDNPLWELEEAVAPSLGKHPDDLSMASIREKCPEEIANRKLARTQPHVLSPLAQLHMRRCEHLRRAAYAEELPSSERGGKIWFKPGDFLRWYDTKSGWKENFVPVLMLSILKAWRAKSGNSDADTEKEKTGPSSSGVSEGNNAAGADTGKSNTEKGKADFSSLGVSKDQRGVAETWELLCSEMSKPLNKREYRTAKACKEYCDDTFRIRHHDFVKLIAKANETPGLTPWPIGRPKKAR